MKITGIEATAISVPVKASFWTSLQAMGGGKAVSELIVKVHTDDGLVGLGEGHGGPPLAAAKLIQSELQALLIGEDPLRPEYLWQKLFSITHPRRSAWEVWGISREQLEVALAAIDIALWDLVGKQAGLPLEFIAVYGMLCLQRQEARARAGLRFTETSTNPIAVLDSIAYCEAAEEPSYPLSAGKFGSCAAWNASRSQRSFSA